ncbi:MAG: hypothetical protein LC775_07680, partial [Acidobacteria bacterium]|nr:hypothetical protein [Acidobacteriota bacterium]
VVVEEKGDLLLPEALTLTGEPQPVVGFSCPSEGHFVSRELMMVKLLLHSAYQGKVKLNRREN